VRQGSTSSAALFLEGDKCGTTVEVILSDILGECWVSDANDATLAAAAALVADLVRRATVAATGNVACPPEGDVWLQTEGLQGVCGEDVPTILCKCGVSDSEMKPALRRPSDEGKGFRLSEEESGFCGGDVPFKLSGCLIINASGRMFCIERRGSLCLAGSEELTACRARPDPGATLRDAGFN
jgi:hypothetical protein